MKIGPPHLIESSEGYFYIKFNDSKYFKHEYKLPYFIKPEKSYATFMNTQIELTLSKEGGIQWDSFP